MRKRIKKFFIDYARVSRYRSAELLEWEVREMEKIFTVLLFGFAAGIPAAPVNISMEMLQVMDADIDALIEGIALASEPVAELFSLFDIG